MNVNTVNMIYLGRLPLVDTVEGNTRSEDASKLIGTYQDSSDLRLTELKNHDANHDGVISDDEMGQSDYVTYRLDGTDYAARPDSSVMYEASVTEEDGTVTKLSVAVIQFHNGDTFVTDLHGANDLDDKKIDSIELTKVVNANYSGYYDHHSVENTVVCFASGTPIRTAKGIWRVEELFPGDMIQTADHGLRALLWVGASTLDSPGRHAPIRIARGALGPGLPDRDLVVSPQHRVLVRSRIARRMFDTEEVLIAAKRLLPLDGVTQEDPNVPVTYHHLLFDGHELVEACGLWAESLYNGPAVRRVVPAAQRAELAAVFGPAWPHVRTIPANARQRRLVERHTQNDKPLVAV